MVVVVVVWWCFGAAAAPSLHPASPPPPRRVGRPVREGSYLVDPASSHMLVSKIKPCMSKYKLLIL